MQLILVFAIRNFKELNGRASFLWLVNLDVFEAFLSKWSFQVKTNCPKKSKLWSLTLLKFLFGNYPYRFLHPFSNPMRLFHVLINNRHVTHLAKRPGFLFSVDMRRNTFDV